jgi:hypothetical protein
MLARGDCSDVSLSEAACVLWHILVLVWCIPHHEVPSYDGSAVRTPARKGERSQMFVLTVNKRRRSPFMVRSLLEPAMRSILPYRAGQLALANRRRAFQADS